MSDQELRIGDAEREQAATDLGEHYAQGRITTEEHRERLDQIWAARTRRELEPVFADLPGRTFPARPASPPSRPAGRSGAGFPRRCWSCSRCWSRWPSSPALPLILIAVGVMVPAQSGPLRGASVTAADSPGVSTSLAAGWKGLGRSTYPRRYPP